MNRSIGEEEERKARFWMDGDTLIRNTGQGWETWRGGQWKRAIPHVLYHGWREITREEAEQATGSDES